MICSVATQCSGCSEWGRSPSAQLASKRERIADLFRAQGLVLPAQIESAALPDRGLRDRLDFQIRDTRLGLWNQEHREILDLPECLQLSKELQNWLTDFRALSPRVPRGSFRLRVSPSGRRGVWLDLANEDVKSLFEERTVLAALAEVSHVEVGQRRKTLCFDNGRPKLLKESRLENWSRTWVRGQAFDLASHIGDFSQVGDVANRALIASLETLLPAGRELVEFGAGNGNLTFAAAGVFETVRAVEFDSSVQKGFAQNLESFRAKFPHKQVSCESGDFQKRTLAFGEADTVLLNPPRSGVGHFLNALNASRAEHLIYMSCYPESMAMDLAKLGSAWACRRLILVDQFPQTAHVEVMALFSRTGSLSAAEAGHN